MPPRTAEDILIQTTSEGAPNGRLILCRDSFGNALHPFLAAWTANLIALFFAFWRLIPLLLRRE